MPTIGQTITAWLDNGTYPPAAGDLPSDITVEDGILNPVVVARQQSVTAKKEYGAGIGYWNDGRLELGTLKEGDEASITTSSRVTPKGSAPIGTFHTHPDRTGFQAPSPADIWSLMCSDDIVELVAAASGWTYLLVRTADAKFNKSSDSKTGGFIDRYIQETAGKVIPQVALEIRKEMTGCGIPSSVEIDPLVPKQIGYERSLIQVCAQLKVGLYWGNSAVLVRRA